MDKAEYKDRFDKLYSNLLGACATFYVWKGLQEKSYETTYSRAIYFWSATLLALQNEWLLSLAKCFEESSFSKNNKVISVYALIKHHPDFARAKKLDDFLNKHKKVIGPISRLRDNQLAHLNAKHLKNPAKLLKKFPIDYGEVEDLLNDFPNLISLLNPEPGIGYGLDNYIKVPVYEAKHVMTQIQYFNQLEKEHLDRFVTGEIDDPNFPPIKNNTRHLPS
ncbi:MAG: hypothetical protein A3J09_00290 [Candidatus Zambryskibacteria bacterium RIFCSPLOWO2_02_FULL_51_21]|uniref:HEPN AbiU2-like domain-containing protein n=1 Tax=Candidatus Zambryskibacteria bacterium RIFCSPHIGHO2_02_FULL_43_37 TaxID=1802749 RepID=A0A1G2THV2_9BACT|nr:MAG: hypothetical protein A2723_00290 [Candidatus Zambryskibacteria bacterium RIFCSPHIGHO2_01_FULL_52_18]OHA96894.1 MAG: hypothetical protein A3D49_02190 [Candidatus Zambryskibacteria bacterium RIFCSPHIGHO2_02_FULL_43_37]OHB07049.1 MAG: hypothetical protein A2944_02165 [Candidatus Zambryskibacteria bacterium RIFCSPLOWO2_01_FULL_52_12]OHB11006.1 MAG: hypothetical protein A3J09_00290 [Candidatus Zambryskibacteria bacterium RIFCSPLOWO2_02_FULL_51_21]